MKNAKEQKPKGGMANASAASEAQEDPKQKNQNENISFNPPTYLGESKGVRIYSWHDLPPSIGDPVGTGGAKQSFTDECDINNIMKKHKETGMVSHVSKHPAEYGYATGETFTEAMLVISQATSMFEQLPAVIRAEFENSPQKFLSFAEDPANRPRMDELGLTLPDVPEAPIQVAIATPDVSSPPPEEAADPEPAADSI